MVANGSFDNVTELNYLETDVINKNCIYKLINSRLHSGNASCNGIQGT